MHLLVCYLNILQNSRCDDKEEEQDECDDLAERKAKKQKIHKKRNKEFLAGICLCLLQKRKLVSTINVRAISCNSCQEVAVLTTRYRAQYH